MSKKPTEAECQTWLTAMNVVADAREFNRLVCDELDSLPTDPTELAGWRFAQRDITERQEGHRHHLTEERRAEVSAMLRVGEFSEYGKKLKESGIDHLARLKHMLWIHRPLNDVDLLTHEGHIRDWLSAIGCDGGLTHHDILGVVKDADAVLKRMDADVRNAWAANQITQMLTSGSPYYLSEASVSMVEKRIAAGEKTSYGQLLKRRKISLSVQLRHLIHRYGRGVPKTD